VRIEKTIREAIEPADRHLDSYEVVVVNDGSTDQTGAIADRLAATFNGRLRVIHLSENKGVGNAFAIALNESQHEYITLIPGDNAFSKTGIDGLFQRVGEADLVVSYRANPNARTFLRRRLSRTATFLMRLLSGKAIRDAHSLFVYPVRLVKEMSFSTGYGYHMETLVRLLSSVERFIELPVELNPKPDASSGVMKVGTLYRLGLTVCRLFLLKAQGRL